MEYFSHSISARVIYYLTIAINSNGSVLLLIEDDAQNIATLN